MIRLECPHCHAKYRVNAKKVGLEGALYECFSCHQHFDVPAAPRHKRVVLVSVLSVGTLLAITLGLMTQGKPRVDSSIKNQVVNSDTRRRATNLAVASGAQLSRDGQTQTAKKEGEMQLPAVSAIVETPDVKKKIEVGPTLPASNPPERFPCAQLWCLLKLDGNVLELSFATFESRDILEVLDAQMVFLPDRLVVDFGKGQLLPRKGAGAIQMPQLPLGRARTGIHPDRDRLVIDLNPNFTCPLEQFSSADKITSIICRRSDTLQGENHSAQ